jgi:hypothetical protein
MITGVDGAGRRQAVMGAKRLVTYRQILLRAGVRDVSWGFSLSLFEQAASLENALESGPIKIPCGAIL